MPPVAPATALIGMAEDGRSHRQQQDAPGPGQPWPRPQLLLGGHPLSSGEAGEDRQHRRQVRIRQAQRAIITPQKPCLAVGPRHRASLVRTRECPHHQDSRRLTAAGPVSSAAASPVSAVRGQGQPWKLIGLFLA